MFMPMDLLASKPGMALRISLSASLSICCKEPFI